MRRIKKKYHNPYQNKVKKSALDILLWKSGYYNEGIDYTNFPKDFKYPLNLDTYNPSQPSVVWINHSTFLITIDGINILTDPIWGECCSPIPLLSLKRLHPPSIKIADLPRIDYVLVSHNHYDHLDKKSVVELNKRHPKAIWCVAQGIKRWMKKRHINNVYELKWWDNVNFTYSPNKSLSITSVPSQHFSGRKISDYNKALWCGFVIDTKIGEHYHKKLYFAGDTGYNPYDFKKIGEKWHNIDLGLIPIGAYVPRKFMGPVHINPYESVKIHKEIGSNLSIGMHFKTFNLSDEPVNRPPFDLFCAMQKEGIDNSKFIAIDPGVYVNW
jgi:N-acyl-phosphatidylethanolamine-hydrolysing phospholipase D